MKWVDNMGLPEYGKFSFSKYIKDRVKNKNKNFIMVICGETGSGKSYAALDLAKLVDGHFNMDRVAFTAQQFMDILNSGKVKKGQVILWDEAGLGVPAREFYTIANRSISYVFQTFRHRNISVILTTPHFGLIDSQIRSMIHCYGEMAHIDHENQISHMKVQRMEHDPKTGKTYFKYFRTGKGANTVKFTQFPSYLPPSKLLDKYEEKKSKQTDMWNKKAQAEIQAIEAKMEKKNEKPKTLEEQAKEIWKEYGDLLVRIRKNGDKVIDRSYMMAKIGMHPSTASAIKSILENEYLDQHKFGSLPEGNST